MRRFRTEPVAAKDALRLARDVFASANRKWFRWWPDRAMFAPERAARLILHWWAAGHDQERNIMRRQDCDYCVGQGEFYNATLGCMRTCHRCSGTGRDEGKKL